MYGILSPSPCAPDLKFPSYYLVFCARRINDKALLINTEPRALLSFKEISNLLTISEV